MWRKRRKLGLRRRKRRVESSEGEKRREKKRRLSLRRRRRKVEDGEAGEEEKTWTKMKEEIKRGRRKGRGNI